MAKMVRLRLNIGSGSGSAHECSALAEDSNANKARGVPPLASNGLGAMATAELQEPRLSMPEPMLSLSMTILVKPSDLGQMICCNSDDII